eukprot:3360913-Alexandrium_andersonii.AAC.1
MRLQRAQWRRQLRSMQQEDEETQELQRRLQCVSKKLYRRKRAERRTVMQARVEELEEAWRSRDFSACWKLA